MAPTECPISGQIRKRCAIPESCTRTCDNIKRIIPCPRICNINGCECPNGMVVNNITKQCVEPTKCPLADGKSHNLITILNYIVYCVMLCTECPPVCSHEHCSRKKKNTKCSM